jgi:hypothetical protein
MRYLLIILFMLLPSFASAHILRIDNGMGVTMHIQPDDAPVAGKSSEIFIDITDSNNRFKATDCACQLTISHRGSELAKIPVTSPEGYTTIGFGFAKPGSYTFTVSGASLTDQFDDFITSFTYYVKSGDAFEEKNVNPLKSYIPYIVFSVSLAIIGIYLGPPLVQKGRDEN